MRLNRDAKDDLPGRLRVGFVVVDDGLYTHRWVAPLLDRRELQTVCVACLSPYWAVDFNARRARGLWPVARARLAYYGLAATLGFAWKAAGTTLSGLRFRVGLGGVPGSVASAVRARGVELLRPQRSDINDARFRARLKTLRPDLLVCAFSQTADQAFLDLPRLGCLNVHFSLLPQHRGREPLFHAMLAGQGAGVSVHWMAPQLDAGPVVVQEPLECARFRTLHRLILAACDLAATVVPAAIETARSGRPAECDVRPATPLAGWPSPEEVTRFKARGFRFV
jgi:folate-dependent phosphoribosylglycinamide formyltransferase PurN